MYAYRAHGGRFVLASQLSVATGDRKGFQETNSSNSQSTISGMEMELIENRTFEEISVGDAAVLERTLTEQDITLFAVMSGDINPAHVDPEYAMSSRFREVIVLCVRWYLRFKLSLRDLVEMMAERGLSLAHATIMRCGFSTRHRSSRSGGADMLLQLVGRGVLTRHMSRSEASGAIGAIFIVLSIGRVGQWTSG